MQVLDKTMNLISLYVFLSINILCGQTNSINTIGQLNDPNAPPGNQIAEATIYSQPADRSKPTLLKIKYPNYDTIVELVYDPTYKGTAIELEEGVNAGTLERYIVIEQDDKFHERVKVVVFEESFLEKYWIYIGLGLAIAVFAYYKLTIQKQSIDNEIAETDTTEKTDL